jgi:tetratricopeptide (TPR) repeat protein
MGVVYHAWDDELGVALALKVIRPEVMADPEAARDVERRFKRELLLARQVTHRNVVRIHDLGEVEGIKYLTMPFVEGRNLGTMLREDGALPVPRALRIAKQVATGLQAAHDAGVVHRDLKPENIMIEEDDRALIMDFGISRSMSGTGAGTMMGAVVGTLEYMAPEQGRGQPVDQRADIYAFGLMLYDMIAGRTRLQAAESAVAEMMSRMTKAPPKLGTCVGNMPEPLESIVARCIDPDPARRYQSTAELVADLDALDAEGRRTTTGTRPRQQWAVAAALAAILTAGAVGATWWLTRNAGSTADAVARDPVSVLIADFENRAGDPVFEGALEQALAIAMEGSPMVTVYPQRAARALASEIAPLAQGRLNGEVGQLIARREGIKVLLAGVIDKSGEGYRLSIRATDPASQNGEIATAARTVRGKADVLKAVASLAESIRTGLGETKTDMEAVAAAETFTAGSLEAMREYARGQELVNAGHYHEALKALQAAVAADKAMGRAFSLMGAIYVNLKQNDRADASFQEAFKHFDRMSEREQYRTQATYYLGVVGNYEKAIESYEKLIESFPADNVAYGNLAFGYVRVGNISRAKDVARQGLQIYPRNLLQRTNYAAYCVYAGEFDTAMKEAERVLAENPKYEFAYLPLALAKAGAGDLEGARATYTKLKDVSETGQSLSVLGLADLDVFVGRLDSAASALTEGLILDEKTGSTGELAAKHLVRAEIALARGDRPAAASAAKKAIAAAPLVNVIVPAARVLIESGAESSAREVVKDLDRRLQNQTTAYARVLEGEIALKARDYPRAIDLLKGALEKQDLWLARFVLGRAYLEAGPQHAVEALDEWKRCYERRGESVDLFFADSPTVRYTPQLQYWLGRAHEGVRAIGSAAAAYREYVRMRSEAAQDPLVADARRRLEALQ